MDIAINYVKNLIYFATVDGGLEERERDYIIRAGRRIGMEAAEVEKELASGELQRPDPPENEVLRFFVLDDLFKLMAVDGLLHEAEIKLLEEHASYLGFENNIVGDLYSVLSKHKSDGFLGNHISSLAKNGILFIDSLKKQS